MPEHDRGLKESMDNWLAGEEDRQINEVKERLSRVRQEFDRFLEQRKLDHQHREPQGREGRG